MMESVIWTYPIKSSCKTITINYGEGKDSFDIIGTSPNNTSYKRIP